MSQNKEIKISELLKSLTMGIISKQSMSEQLWEWLNMDPQTLYKDVVRYINLEEGHYTKKEIENKIQGGPGADGLTMLMEFYQNEWTVIANDDSGEEMEMLLYDAMQYNDIGEFQTKWKLEELDSNWAENDITLVDEDDGFDVEYYEM